MKKVILVIDDDTSLRNFICNSLIKKNYNCVPATCGQMAIKELKKRCFDLVILDLDLGDINGKEILDLMRKQSIEIPVIVVSTFNNINMKVDLFETGCDDYLTKPFYIEELNIRVKRLLERVSNPVFKDLELLNEEVVVIGGEIEINFYNLTLYKRGKPLELTKKLFDLLSYFIKNSDRIITKEQIISRFWNDPESYSENSLTVHIHKLRTLIEDDPSKPQYLLTKRGLGYLFVS